MGHVKRIPGKTLLFPVLLALPLLGGLWLGQRGAPDSSTHSGKTASLGDLRACHDVDTSIPERDECYVSTMHRLLDDNGPQYVIELDHAAEGDELLGDNCHVMMHDVAERYVRNHAVTAANITTFLPDSNSVNCAAGLTHGLMTEALKSVADTDSITGMTAACEQQGVRIRQINCIHGLGHSFMRATRAHMRRSLALCDKLGSGNATDCAPGVFHEYFFGIEETAGAAMPAIVMRDPRQLCASVAARFVRPCWLRAVQFSTPANAEPPSDVGPLVRNVCTNMSAAQRSGCITAQAFRTSDGGLDSCFRLAIADVRSCLLGFNADPTRANVLESCSQRPTRARSACYEWFGQLHAIFANPPGDRSFCTDLSEPEGVRHCLRGAARARKPLGVL